MAVMIDRFKAWTKTDLAHDIAHVLQSVAITVASIYVISLFSWPDKYRLLGALPAILIGLIKEYIIDLNPSLRDLAGWVVPALLVALGHLLWRMA